jgi:hypothetical protein
MDDYKDFYWNNVKNWWNNINIDNNLFNNEYFTPKTENDKNIFKIKFLYVIKQIFEIENLEYIDKIVCYNNCEIPSNIQSRIHYINSENIYNNILKNKNLFKLFIQDDNKLKKIFEYIIQYKDYLKLIIQKILNIFKPLFEEDCFDKLINIDEDITRIISPIAGTFLYLYITNNDLEYVIETFLNLDYVYIEFFMISYLIIDNIMDSSKITSSEKKKFMVWFMNIVSNPEDTIFIGHEATEQNVWRYILFKKYYNKFIERYPPNKYPNIYEYVKIMINMLNTANKVQRDKNSSEEQILEYTFKKSYVVSYFIALLINIELNKTLDENKLLQMSKLVFLIQIYDDIADVEKDIIENNYTYFSSSQEGLPVCGAAGLTECCRSDEGTYDSSGAKENLSSGENNLFELKLKKTIYATYDFLNSFDKIENVNSNGVFRKLHHPATSPIDPHLKQALMGSAENNINNIIYYILENSLLYILYINSNKMNNDLLDNFFKHSLISIDCLKYFDKNSYDQFNGNFMIKIIDKNINNGELELEKFGENFDV